MPMVVHQLRFAVATHVPLTLSLATRRRAFATSLKACVMPSPAVQNMVNSIECVPSLGEAQAQAQKIDGREHLLHVAFAAE